jgi:hypothetical protein
MKFFDVEELIENCISEIRERKKLKRDIIWSESEMDHIWSGNALTEIKLDLSLRLLDFFPGQTIGIQIGSARTIPEKELKKRLLDFNADTILSLMPGH